MGRRRFGRGFGFLAGSKEGKVSESGKDLDRGARGTERRFRVEIREGLDIGNLLSFFSAFTEGVEIPESVRVKYAI
jgi:hypothetical protein